MKSMRFFVEKYFFKTNYLLKNQIKNAAAEGQQKTSQKKQHNFFFFLKGK